MDALQAYLEAISQGDDQSAQGRLPALIRQGEAALERLTPLLNHPNPDIRWWVVRALAEIQADSAARLLIKSLGDEDVTVRQCAALALCRRPDIRAVPDLISTLGEPDRLLARLAGQALISLGPPAVPSLIEVMRGGPHIARLEAARALALIGDSRAIPVLFEALDDQSAYVGFWSDEGLDRMGVGMVFFKP
jgi:HEAT repeat protein